MAHMANLNYINSMNPYKHSRPIIVQNVFSPRPRPIHQILYTCIYAMCIHTKKTHQFGYQFHDVSCVYIYIYVIYCKSIAGNKSKWNHVPWNSKAAPARRSFDPDQRMPPWETWCGGVLSWRLMRTRHTSGWWGWGWWCWWYLCDYGSDDVFVNCL